MVRYCVNNNKVSQKQPFLSLEIMGKLIMIKTEYNYMYIVFKSLYCSHFEKRNVPTYLFDKGKLVLFTFVSAYVIHNMHVLLMTVLKYSSA